MTVTNVSISIETGTDGLLIINPKMRSVIENVHIFVTASQSHMQLSSSNGAVILKYFQANFSKVYIWKFNYKQQLCLTTVNENVFYVVFL